MIQTFARRLKVAAVGVALFGAAGIAGLAQAECCALMPPPNTPILYHQQGGVLLKKPGQPAVPIYEGMAVPMGSKLKTSDGSNAGLEFPDGQLVRLKQNSEVNLKQYNYNPAQPQQTKSDIEMTSLGKDSGFSFKSGVGSKANPAGIKVSAGDTAMGVEGTEFLVVSDEDGSGLFTKILDGGISVTTGAGIARFGKDQGLVTVGPNGFARNICDACVPPGVLHSFSLLEDIPTPCPTCQ